MKRDFEREFKELKLSEVPDLWNRIEAGLSEKKIAASVSVNAATTSNVYKLTKRPIWRWGTLVAACMCIALIIPALSLVLGNLGGRKNNYSGSAANSADGSATDIASSDMGNASENITSNEMNGSFENMTDVSEIIEGAEATYESDMTMESETTDMSEIKESQNAVDSMNSMENSQSADTLNSTKRSQEASNADIADASASKAEKAMSDSAEASDDGITNGYALNLELEDGQILKGVVVEILESTISGKDTVYKAVVKQQDEEGFLNAGMEISIVCNSGTKYDSAIASSEKQDLKVKESYEVSLRYEKNNNKTGQSADISESDMFVAIRVFLYK